MTSIFEGQPPKTRPFPIKTRVIWVLGMSIYIYIYIFIYIYIYSTFFMMEEPDGSPKAWRIFGTFFGVEALGRRRAELRTPISIFVSCFLPKKTHTNNFPFRILGIRLLEWICSTWIKGIHEPFRIKSSFFLKISIFLVFVWLHIFV